MTLDAPEARDALAAARGAGRGAAADRVVVACAADRRYVLPLAVMLASLADHADAHRAVDVHVVDGGIAAAHRERLSRVLAGGNVRLRWLSPERARVADLPVWGRLSPFVYQRLLLPDLLPDEDAVIWLDCDLLFQADVGRLWDTPLGDFHLLAAQDLVVPYVSSPLGVARHAELGIPSSAKYFNAGVMLVDLARWREDDVAARVADYLQTHRRDVVFLEQEGLNAVLADAWGELDGRWNHNASVAGRPFFRPRGFDPAAYRRIVDDPWIVHFSGNIKPWTTRWRTPQRELYFRYLDRTPWAGWRPPATLRGDLVGRYESSSLRRAVYPAEKWVLEGVRRLTRDGRRRPPRPAAARVGKGAGAGR